MKTVMVTGVNHKGYGSTSLPIGPKEGKGALSRAAVAGNRSALDLFAEAGQQLGTALSSLVHLFDPSELHISGEGVDVWEFWEPSFTRTLREHLPAHRRDLRVIVDDWAEDTWAHGAASLVFASPFSSRRDHALDEVRDLLRTPPITREIAGHSLTS